MADDALKKFVLLPWGKVFTRGVIQQPIDSGIVGGEAIVAGRVRIGVKIQGAVVYDQIQPVEGRLLVLCELLPLCLFLFHFFLCHDGLLLLMLPFYYAFTNCQYPRRDVYKLSEGGSR